uniref:Zinc finger and SCAN domain-containing protein 2 n=1 Tax=Culex pipiens TaxID=7175 RepID=A0A8D8F5T1_CULPI
MDINLQIAALDYPTEEDPRLLITLLTVPAIMVVPKTFCSFCLRERPLDGAYYGYNIDNSHPILRETMEEIFGPKFKLEKFSICTPCWNMIQLMDDFRTCCFEANSRAEQIKSGLKSEDDWFTQDTVKMIEAMHSAVRDQIEQIKTSVAEAIHEPNSNNNVITIDDSDDERDSTNLVIDDQPLEDQTEDAIETEAETENSIVETNTPTVDQIPEEQQPDPDSIMVEEAGPNTPPEVPPFSIKIEPEDNISEENSMQLVIEEQRSPLLDRPDNIVKEEPTDQASILPQILIENIKSEVVLPEESMDAEYGNQTPTPEDHERAVHEEAEPDNLFTEISVENIKIEKDEVREKIAHLLNARVLQCGRCGTSFKFKRGLIIHLNNCKDQTAVGPDVMYTCQICWASYRSRTNFKAHINQHIDHKPYKCRLQCKKHFFGLKGRLKHEEKCNSDTSCSVCDRTFAEKELLFAHIKSAHGKIKFTCEICDIRFPHRVALRRHGLKMHKERAGGIPCRRCNTHVSKTAHEANLHVKECRERFTFDCDECDAKLQTPSHLKTHKELYHDEPKYDCNFCGKKFKRKEIAVKHQITHSKANKKYPCAKCDKTFGTTTNLKRHMNVHLPVRPYPCPTCEKRFSSKQAMEIHAKLNCANVREGKITCPFCRKKYLVRATFKKHIEEKHWEQLQDSAFELQIDTM